MQDTGKLMQVVVIQSDQERVFLDWERVTSFLVPCKPQLPEVKHVVIFKSASSTFPHLPGWAVSKTQSYVRSSHKYE